MCTGTHQGISGWGRGRLDLRENDRKWPRVKSKLAWVGRGLVSRMELRKGKKRGSGPELLIPSVCTIKEFIPQTLLEEGVPVCGCFSFIYSLQLLGAGCAIHVLEIRKLRLREARSLFQSDIEGICIPL